MGKRFEKDFLFLQRFSTPFTLNMLATRRFFRSSLVNSNVKSLSSRNFSKYIVSSPLELPELKTDLGRTPLPIFLLNRAVHPSRIDKEALVDGHTQKSLTYGDAYYISLSFADSLKDLGIQKNDCIAIMSPNHLLYFPAFLGISCINAISSCINPLYSETEIKHQIETTNSNVIITHPCCLERVLKATAERNMKVIVIDDENTKIDKSLISPKHQIVMISSMISKDRKPSKYPHLKDLQTANFDENSVVTIPFSSGTTGRSKGVLLTHKNLVANVLQTAQVEPPNTNVLVPLPFFHIYGLVVGLFTGFYNGSKLVFMSAFDLQLFLENLQNHSIARAYIVPPIVLALAKHPLVDKYNLKSLKVILSGAAPLGAEVQQAAGKRLNVIIKQGWGMTELSPLASVTPDHMVSSLEDIKGTSGPLVAGTEGKIVHPETGVDMLPSEEGELLIRGPQVMKGYLNNPEATARTLRPDGWLHTGDIAVFDERGRLYITDRLKELIKYKGFQVPPAELEGIIASMKEVKDVVVIPVPDDEAGEVPRAYVVKQDGCRSDFCDQDVIEYVHQHVAPYKRLRGGVRFTEAIPKTPSGKLLRRVQIQIDREANQQRPAV
jgi:acyl-CoA synthetase (AMP-forming)/AMP-acid ligase II